MKDVSPVPAEVDDGDRHTLPIVEREQADREQLLRTQREMDALLFDYRSLLRASRALHYCRDKAKRSQIIERIVSSGFALSRQ